MNAFRSNIISIYGEKGQAWIVGLPQLVAAISSKLDLRDLKEVTNLSYNYVLSGFQGDNPIILKLGLDHEALTREAFVLKCFAGHGAVNVLAEDKGMLLLERALPGTSLKSYFVTPQVVRSKLRLQPLGVRRRYSPGVCVGWKCTLG